LKEMSLWKDSKATLRIVLVYALFGGLWILLSDTVMGVITRNPDLLRHISVFKGLAFILTTSLLLYHLINRHVRSISDINRRLQSSMEDLQSVHQRLQLADFSIRNISDAVYWVTMDGRFLDCNDAACTMLGYDRAEFLSMSVTDLDPDYANEDIAADLEELKRTGNIKLVRSHRAKDGRTVPVEISSNYLDCQGREYICAIARDITERVRAERETSFFGTLIEFSRDPFYVLDPADGYRMVYANRAACEHYGVSLEQLQTMRIPDWDPAFDMASVDELLQHLREGKPARLETVHKVASGKLVPVEVTSSFLVHDGREYTFGYFYDITGRKAMEEALKKSESRYRGLFLEFQALLDGIPDGLTLLSPNLEVLWANPAAALATGHEPRDLIGRYCYQVRHELDKPCDDCIVLGTLRTGELKETLQVSHTGRSIELRSVPVRDEEGKIVKVIEIGRDVTDQIAAEAERNELERKLLHAHKLESLGILAGGIAHDFNNILTGILGNLSILRMHLPEGHKGLERIERCEKAVSRATGLTCQLLTFSKGGDPVKKPIDLRHLVDHSVSFALTGSNVASEVNIADDLCTVNADEGQLEQVLNNLLINAVQAMPLGGVVRVSAANRPPERLEPGSLEQKRYVSIVVSDQGEGIMPKNLAKIFDPYFTTKETGSGLGLTSAYSIVRKHGGDISVVSEPGKGTTFEILIPASSHAVNIDNNRVHQGVSVGKGFIMVMDDEEYIRDMVCEMLSMTGYEAEGFSRGEDLVQAYRNKLREGNAPCAVILDLTIPGGMGGLETAKSVLEIDPGVRLIVASGYSNNPVMANYRQYGFVAALTKPYRLEDISSELEKVLREDDGARH
jgi:PAS domain S-box-containing protein